jgi:murein DD-endopeptidase MepM/ murein hydrolase activator NlpD
MKNFVAFVLLLVLAGFTSGYIKALPSILPVKDPPPSSISSKLAFPVSGKKSSIGSFWGAARDGGKRKHEGIDIFAKKGTPVVAVTDGIVSAVTNGGIGGKTVWLRSFDYSWTAYYAHLDQQKVKRGQFVKKGEVLGTVGNTGNARTTPAHLHFGIYTWNGAVNPLPYVKQSPKVDLSKPVQPETLIASEKKKYVPIIVTTNG